MRIGGRGLLPFAVVSTAGTTNTGAVDPLDDVADLCEREGLWHHVDGAYGAFFCLSDELRPVLHGPVPRRFADARSRTRACFSRTAQARCS